MEDSEFYKKYRPSCFADFKGNDALCESLIGLIRSGKLPHTILFHGPSGCGKTTLARIVSRELGISDIDYYEYDSASFRGIDTAREIRDNMMYPPLSGSVKLVVLDEVHKMTNDAQNALLKPLEDTPRWVYFVLCTTNPEKLIRAIRTRCAAYEVKALEPKVLGPQVLVPIVRSENLSISKDVLKAICRNSGGSVREALQLLQKVSEVTGDDAQLALCSSPVSETVETNIAKAVASDDWNACAEAIRSLDDSKAEGVRIGILRYLQTILLKTGDIRIFTKMCAFEKDTFSNGKVQLTLACFEATHQE